MDKFVIVTDSTADLTDEILDQYSILQMQLSCIFEGVTYGKDKKLDIKDFYEKVRGGSMPTTSQLNPEDIKDTFVKLLEQSNDILYIAFSSGLSGTYQSGVIAANEVMEDNPNANIVVIDSLNASLGEGLLVYKAAKKREAGASFQETVDYIESIKSNVCAIFTVDDLNHLSRGGRISKSTAVIGTMIGIKPILHVDDAGNLTNIDKCRGRKKSLLTLVLMMQKQMGSFADTDKDVFISHGDCIEDAEFLASEIKDKLNKEVKIINYVGPVIGSHSGPGTVALFFMGDSK